MLRMLGTGDDSPGVVSAVWGIDRDFGDDLVWGLLVGVLG